MYLKKLLAISFLAMSASLSALASDVVVPVDPIIEGHEVPAKGLYFSGSFEFELSSEVEDVLQRGITLYFVIEVEVEKKRWYWFDRPICGIKETIRLSFNPLTRSYRVAIGGMTQSFASLEGALRFIKTINNLYVGSYRSLNPEDYEARSRFYLDTSKLPRPFQVTLRKDDGWNLNSGWFDAEIKGAGEK